MNRLVPIVRDATVVAGFCLVTYGSWLAWRPAGFLVSGALLLVGGLVGALRA